MIQPPKVHLLILIPVFCMGVRVATAQGKRNGYFDRGMHTYRGDINPFRSHRYWTVGGGLYTLQYSGDLTSSNLPVGSTRALLRGGLGAFAAYKAAPRFSIQGELMLGRIAGDDFVSSSIDDPVSSGLYIRNLSFRNNLVELSLTGRLDLIANRRPYAQRPRLNPYLRGGIGLLWHNPQGKVPEFRIDGARFENAGTWVALRPLGTEGQQSPYYSMRTYSRFVFVTPFGGGIEFRINTRTSLQAELIYHYTFTDYLDDVSGKYVDLGALDGDLAKAMSDRSREEKAVMSGEMRDLEAIQSRVNVITYVSRFDGQTYTVFSGFGSEGSQRGGDSNDLFFSASVKLAYILNKKGSYGSR